MRFHPLLERQLRALFGSAAPLTSEVAAIAERVDAAYRQSDDDRILLERSLELSSQELLQANSEMRLIIRALPDLFLRLTSDGQITSCRAQSDEDLVDAMHRMVGRRIQRLSGREARAAFEKALADMAAGATSASVEYSLRVRGEEREYEARLMPLCEGQLLAVIRNITVRRRAEAELNRAREGALEVAHLKAQFLANTSHEIRTPMTCIIGMTELALETDLDRQQREFMEAIKKSADGLMVLLNDVLDFSKIEAGRLTLEEIPFSLRDCLRDALKPFSLQASRKGIELACHVAPEVPERVLGDPGRIRQMIVNLVGNAIKFTERGDVVVSVSLKSEAETRANIEFVVRDTGIGVPSDKQESIFEAFMQADGSMTRRFGGTGLGLTICSQLVRLMGSKIEIESEPGRGSAFTFAVPFEIEAPGAGPLVPAPLHPLRGTSVLVIDDSNASRQVISNLLRHWGARSVTARTGPIGLRALQRAKRTDRSFDLILLDMQMPVLDGFAVAERIREDLGSHLPVIVLTSTGDSGDAARCRELGISGYLTKPIFGSELLEAIRTVLGNVAAGHARTFVTRHSLREERSRLRLLLAEDNVFNRQIIERLLEKRGHYVQVVEDGRQALEAVESHSFDLLLLDVQMPGLDGLEVARAIRKMEQGSDRRLPIVALTAHALPGDRERCLESGMDGYATKPIDAQGLLALIESVTGSRDTERDPPSLVDTAVFDSRVAMRHLDDDPSLLALALRLQFHETARALRVIHTALAEEDRDALERSVRQLKDGFATIGARSAAVSAGRVERLARAAEWPLLKLAAGELEHECARLEGALRRTRKAA